MPLRLNILMNGQSSGPRRNETESLARGVRFRSCEVGVRGCRNQKTRPSVHRDLLYGENGSYNGRLFGYGGSESNDLGRNGLHTSDRIENYDDHLFFLFLPFLLQWLVGFHAPQGHLEDWHCNLLDLLGVESKFQAT
jgi:hypothetical protein